jgi:hypothetical protein
LEKPDVWKPLGRSRSRWEHKIRRDLKGVRREWTGLFCLRIGKCLKLVITVMNFRVPVP